MYTNEEKHTQLWKEKSKTLHILSWRHYGISKWGPSAGSKNRRAWSCWKNIRAQGNLHSGKTGSDKETKTKGRMAARQKLKKNLFLLSVLSSLIVSLKLSNQDLTKSKVFSIKFKCIIRILPLQRSGFVILANYVMSLSFLTYKMEFIPPTMQVLGNTEVNALRPPAVTVLSADEAL